MTKTQKIPAIEVQVGDLIGQTKSDPAPRQVLEIRDHSVARSIWLARTDEEVAQTLAHETRMIEQRFIRQHSTGRELDSLRIQPKFTTKVWVTRTTTDQEA